MGGASFIDPVNAANWFDARLLACMTPGPGRCSLTAPSVDLRPRVLESRQQLQRVSTRKPSPRSGIPGVGGVVGSWSFGGHRRALFGGR
jgi:hypothetical protein